MTSTSTNKTWGVNEQTEEPPTRRAGWSHDWQSRWSHEVGRKSLRAVPCSWQATLGVLTVTASVGGTPAEVGVLVAMSAGCLEWGTVQLVRARTRS